MVVMVRAAITNASCKLVASSVRTPDFQACEYVRNGRIGRIKRVLVG